MPACRSVIRGTKPAKKLLGDKAYDSAVIQAKRKDAHATQWAGCCAVPMSMNYLQLINVLIGQHVDCRAAPACNASL